MNSSWFKYLICFAFLIRVVVSIFTYQSDIGAFSIAGKLIIGEGKLFTFYDTPNTNVVFNYQPLAYLIPSLIYLPFQAVVKETCQIFANQDWLPSSPNFNVLLLLYKLPMILADLAFLWLLPKFFEKQNHKKLAMLLWAFNPLAIYVSSMVGQVDIIIALFITLGLYLYKNKQPYWAVVMISLSALIKPAGLILIPILALHYLATHKKVLQSLLLAVTGIGVYLLGIFPYLGSAAYRYHALFAEQIGKSTYAAISIASGHDIPLFFIFYTLILILVWKKRLSLPTAIGSALLASLAFSHFHPQWLVWIMPWLVIYSISKADYFFYFTLIICWLIILFSFDPSLHLQMFIHSKLALPVSLTKSSYFLEIVQISRAGIIAVLIWLLVDYEKD